MAYLALDPKKVYRAKDKVMKVAKLNEENQAENNYIVGIAYDGRKDMAKVLLADSEGRMHQRLIKEEHISVTWEPSGKYLSHHLPR